MSRALKAKNFGVKPRRGGSPSNESRRRGIIHVMLEEGELDRGIWERVETLRRKKREIKIASVRE